MIIDVHVYIYTYIYTYLYQNHIVLLNLFRQPYQMRSHSISSCILVKDENIATGSPCEHDRCSGNYQEIVESLGNYQYII